MRTSWSATFAALAIVLAGMLAPYTAIAAEPPSITAFFKRPSLRAPKLSPSGRYLAVQTAGKGDRMLLSVLDLEDLSKFKVVAGFNDADVYQHHWVNEDRLVFNISDSPDGTTQVMAEGLWAVDRDGSNFRQLINAHKSFITNTITLIESRRLDINWVLHNIPVDGSNDVIVRRRLWSNETESKGVQIARLDTRTGITRNLSQGVPDYVGNWMLDWRGEPYAVQTFREGQSRFYKRDDQGRWQPWFEDDAYNPQHAQPFWIGPDGTVIGTQGYNGYQALFKLDPKTGAHEPTPLVSSPGYDYQGALIFDTAAQRLLGMRHETDAPGTTWLDPTMREVQADIDAKLKGSVNLIQCSRCLGALNLVVTAVSDQRSAEYYLYKPATRQLQRLAQAPAELRPAAMGQRDYHRLRARDGLQLPVLVTQPAGGVKGKTPTVVLVHGGPYVRGTGWQWEPMAQFLASRGYLVLEPEFRGSTGYGTKLFRAGWKQWGLAMQDDLADTLAWAVRQGWADPDRACIMGASYGGYAAMMGAVTQGDLFKCAINWVGVTDIGLMNSIHWSDFSEEWKQYGMKRLVADPDADAEQLRKTSPLLRAKEIRMPLLMAYGAQDRRVPIKHGEDMKAALRADQPVEWVVYPDEGHGWFDLKTNEDFWGRVERFLGKHLAPKN
ncbi:alpha/beta hydrolase family protein [Roseateles sp. DC23W]|uniref:Alpha/beta hydrolase family protein n=1 Tax=Pelomonas dachongensis TaxID=3299029 RepID=A0ABW7EGM6_9BURK